MQFFGMDDKTEELKHPPKPEPPKEKKKAAKREEMTKEVAEISEYILRILPEDGVKK